MVKENFAVLRNIEINVNFGEDWDRGFRRIWKWIAWGEFILNILERLLEYIVE